jgi:hypothetical protein
MPDKDNAPPLKDIVKKVISELDGSAGGAKQERITEEEIKTLWTAVAGRGASRHSRPVSLRKGRLVVMVEDSSLLYELTLRKREILNRLISGLKGKIDDIQFRIGEVHGEEGSEKRR